MYACVTPVGFDTSDKFENHCARQFSGIEFVFLNIFVCVEFFVVFCAACFLSLFLFDISL